MKSTKILNVSPTRPEPNLINAAAGFIKRGSVVVFPTETVYGIGADAFNGVACGRIFEIKQRPRDNPLIVHVASLEQAARVAVIPERYKSGLARVWPSPITIIAKAKPGLPPEVTAGLETVSLRMPAHPVALALIRASGTPIAAPSANPSKKPSATSGAQSIKYFKGKAECIINSGDSFFGIESTIIDLQSFTILRPGPFTVDEIERAFFRAPRVGRLAKGKSSAGKVVSPGTKYRHYAPDTPIFMFTGAPRSIAAVTRLAGLPRFAFIGSAESCHRFKGSGHPTISLGRGNDMYEIAKNLYNALIMLDSKEVTFGIVETFPEKGVGLAIMNRLRKACSGLEFSTPTGLEALVKRACL